MSDINRATFLKDDASQTLALSDALSSANGLAISAAFDAVARTRGLAQIARESNIHLHDLCRALADPARPDYTVLQEVLSAMIRGHPGLGDLLSGPGSNAGEQFNGRPATVRRPPE